jgi:hypothetical protein
MLEQVSDSVMENVAVARGSRLSLEVRMAVARSLTRSTIALTSSLRAMGVTSRSTSESCAARERGTVPRMV